MHLCSGSTLHKPVFTGCLAAIGFACQSLVSCFSLVGAEMANLRDFQAAPITYSPYWWEEAPPLETTDPIPSSTDVIVIGGGYTGLSAALELAHGGASVSVLEAERFGEGASSRNGGFISSGINVGKGADMVAAYGQARADDMLTEANDAYAHLHAVVEREGIRCQIAEPGRFVPAHCPEAYEAQARRIDELNQLTGAEAWMLPQSEQHQELNSDYYFGGLVSNRSGGLHPGLLVRGLALSASRAGAKLHATCPAGRIERLGNGFLVETPHGSIKAREVILATNGYTGQNAGWHRRRIFPVRSHMIATEELGLDLIRWLFPNMRMISDTKRMLSYFRPSPDGRRILFGGRASYRSVDPETAAPALLQNLMSIFPDLENVRVSHAWTGNVAITFDGLPHIGNERGLRYALGCNGSGVVMMTWLGRQVAREILGSVDAKYAQKPSTYSGLPMPTKPFYTGNPWMLPAIGAWYIGMDRFDRWRAGA